MVFVILAWVQIIYNAMHTITGRILSHEANRIIYVQHAL